MNQRVRPPVERPRVDLTPLSSSRRLPTRLRDVDGVRYAVAHAWLVLVVLVAAMVRLPGSVVLVAAVAVVMLASRGLALPWTLGLGIATWAVWTGFVEHRFGQLTLEASDLTRLAVLVAVCGTASALRRRTSARSS